jgi:hypothetical protein
MGGENGAAGQQWRAGQVGGGADGWHCGSASAGRRWSDSTGLVTTRWWGQVAVAVASGPTEVAGAGERAVRLREI